MKPLLLLFWVYEFSPSLKNNVSVLLWWLLISSKCRERWARDVFSCSPPHLARNYTLTSTTSVGWGLSEATCVSSQLVAAPGAGPCGAVAASCWGLLLNFAFLHSCFMTQPSDASRSGRLHFPPRNHFQVTCLGHFPAALPFCPLAVAWEHRPEKEACVVLRNLWGRSLPGTLCLGTEIDGKMVLWGTFVSSNQALSPTPTPSRTGPPLIPALEGGGMQRTLTGSVRSQTSLSSRGLPQPFGPSWSAPRCGRCCSRSPPGLPSTSPASPWDQHSPLHGDLTPGSISFPSDCFHPILLALEIAGEGALFKIKSKVAVEDSFCFKIFGLKRNVFIYKYTNCYVTIIVSCMF